MRLPQRLLAFFLSFALIFSSTSALATTSFGGWTATDSLIAGATTTINATKTAGGKVLQSAVTVAPSAVKVGKHLIKGGGAAALALAVPQLLGDGVEWVLDPANNSVKYKDDDAVSLPNTPTICRYHDGVGYNQFSGSDACRVYSASGSNKGFISFDADSNICHYKASSGRPANIPISVSCTANPDYNPDAPPDNEYKHLPIDTVAAQVISNAEAGDPSSQEAVKATALEGFAAGEHDAALDAAATEAGSDAGTDNPPDTSNPPDTGDPAVPFDPSSIIAAINALKALLAGILSSITSLADWFKADPEEKDNEVDIPDVPLPEPDTDINFGGSCPADLSVNFNLYGTSTDFVLMPFSKFCPLLSTFVKPTLIVLGSFFAVSIVGGRRDE